MSDATIACSLLVDFLGHLRSHGLDAEQVCRAALIDPGLLEAPHDRVPAVLMHRLWQAGEQLTGDPDLGLRSAAAYNPGALNIVGYVVLSCPTAGAVAGRSPNRQKSPVPSPRAND